MNQRRLLSAFVIIVLSYFYFRFFGISSYSFAHILFTVIILGSLVIAFLTKKKDITMGILYGLIFVLISLVLLFTFFVVAE